MNTSSVILADSAWSVMSAPLHYWWWIPVVGAVALLALTLWGIHLWRSDDWEDDAIGIPIFIGPIVAAATVICSLPGTNLTFDQMARIDEAQKAINSELVKTYKITGSKINDGDVNLLFDRVQGDKWANPAPVEVMTANQDRFKYKVRFDVHHRLELLPQKKSSSDTPAPASLRR